MKSLQRQLQLNLAVVLILTLLALLLTTHFSIKSLFINFTSPHLKNEGTRLFNAFEINNAGLGKVRWRRLDPIYNEPYSGRYYCIQFKDHMGTDIKLRSPSLQDEKIAQNAGPEEKVQIKVDGPKNQRLIVWTKVFNRNGKNITVSVAEDMNDLIEQRMSYYFISIIVSLVGFLTILTVLQLVIRRLFSKLNKSQRELKEIQSGTLEQLSEDVPTEIYPLVQEFNQSLSQMQKRMKRSRNALGNLTHAIKTPLSILLQEIEKCDKSMPMAKKQAERIHKLAERELKRARMAGLGSTTQRFDPLEEIPTLIDVLKQAHQKDLNVSYHVANDVGSFGDREDLMELLGNIIDNAFKWAKTEIICTFSTIGVSNGKAPQVKITIEDDGVGGTPEDLKMLTQRGTRLDESVEGHGLGLAISKDIVKLYGGTISFNHSSSLGGLSVEIILPN